MLLRLQRSRQEIDFLLCFPIMLHAMFSSRIQNVKLKDKYPRQACYYQLSQNVAGRLFLITAQCPAALACCPSLTLSVSFLRRMPSSS